MPFALSTAHVDAAEAQDLGNSYYFENSLHGGNADYSVVYGKSSDQTLVGDWNGDGKDTLAVRRGNIYYFKNSISGGNADQVIKFGKSSDDVLAGDWNGDGTDTLAVRRGNTYYLLNSLHGGIADRVLTYGKANDQVLVGDWNGDKMDTFAVRRSNTFYVLDTLHSGKADKVFTYGKATDYVLAGDWDGNGSDTFAVRRGSAYYIKNSLAAGIADTVVAFGKSTDYVLVGDWDGNGTDTFAVRRAASTSSATTPNLADYVSNEAPTQITSTAGTLNDLGSAWASNSVNDTSFRQSSVITAKNSQGEEIQTTAYYDQTGRIILARRSIESTDWKLYATQYSGNVTDAHNVVSLGIDGKGFLHVAWGMHGAAMQYAESTTAWGVTLGAKKSVTGKNEGAVTYPQFYTQSNGNMFLLYRNGSSGNGNLVLDHYNVSTGKWTQVQSDLIDGVTDSISGSSSPYWQAVVDSKNRLQISWVWRESSDVSTNHDLAYARSSDTTGVKWETSTGVAYTGSITQKTAEKIASIDQNSQLMNQTSMTVNDNDNPYIVSYWNPDLETNNQVVQYMVVRQKDDGAWVTENTGIRSPGIDGVSNFDLAGGGSKAVPIARPQIAVSGSGENATVHLIIRDAERGSMATLATETVGTAQWTYINLTDQSLDYWEPTYDTSLWQLDRKLDIFVQKVGQGDGEGIQKYPANHVYILDVDSNLLASSNANDGGNMVGGN
ncbi:MAG: BNR repeat-containing protein [Bifidobacterium sp.]|uniref:BNR repeat-containing protein n=1 Tax=Bifidobacterium sp. TaxID=41200 RepID=UPI0039EA44D2